MPRLAPLSSARVAVDADTGSSVSASTSGHNGAGLPFWVGRTPPQPWAQATPGRHRPEVIALKGRRARAPGRLHGSAAKA